MGNGIAVNGGSFIPATLDNHIEVRRYISTNDGGYYSYSSRDATVSGNIVKTTGDVYINNLLVAAQTDLTNETDTYDLGIWSYVSGAHSNISGSITGGSSTVFVGGKQVARIGDTVTTHGGVTTEINSGSTTVFAG